MPLTSFLERDTLDFFVVMRKFIKVNDYPVISHQSWLPWPPLLLEHNKYFNFPQKEKRDFGNQRFSLPKGYNQAGNRPSVVGWIRKESHHILDGVTELWALSMYGTRWWQSHMGWGQTFLGATLFFFHRLSSSRLKDCVLAISPTQRNFSVCFSELATWWSLSLSYAVQAWADI